MERWAHIPIPWLIVLMLPGCTNSPPVSKDSSPVKALRIDTIMVFDTLPEGWVDVAQLNPELVLDLRYATTNNFVEKKLYDCPRCLLRPAVADALLLVQDSLSKVGYSLKLFDCYRPRPVQEALWQTLPNPSYVTDPKKGSMHNRGAAVDVTLVDSLGHDVDMGTPFDYFGPRAYHTYTDHSADVLAHRRLLREIMLYAGFGHIRTEWWHYSYRVGQFEISDYVWPCP